MSTNGMGFKAEGTIIGAVIETRACKSNKTGKVFAHEVKVSDGSNSFRVQSKAAMGTEEVPVRLLALKAGDIAEFNVVMRPAYTGNGVELECMAYTIRDAAAHYAALARAAAGDKPAGVVAGGKVAAA